MSIPTTDLSVTYTGSVDHLLDSASSGHRAPISWRDFYSTDPDLAIHGFLIPDDLCSFVDAAVGTCLRLGNGVVRLALAITEPDSRRQICFVLVYLSDELVICAAPFDVEQMLPQPGDDIEANAATVLAQIAERANATIARLGSYVDRALRGSDGTGSCSGGAARPEPPA